MGDISQGKSPAYLAELKGTIGLQPLQGIMK